VIAEAFAKPKKLGEKSYCTCTCHVSEELTQDIVVDSRGYFCGLFENKTCNVRDPETDGIRSGRTEACFPANKDGTPATKGDPGPTPPPAKPKVRGPDISPSKAY
jgi:hypothetical protein